MRLPLSVAASVASLLALSAAFAQPDAPPMDGPAPPPPPLAAPPASAAPGAAATATPAPALPVEELRLENGLKVLLAPDDTLPNVAVVVRYHVGTADEPTGLSGIAHLLEHLTYERSAHVPRGALLRLLADGGATDLNGVTSADATLYFATVPPERLELALWLESDRMGYFLGAIDDKALEQERSVVLTELRTRVTDSPAGIAQSAVFESTFPAWHPYHESFETTMAETSGITMADIKAFYSTWYGPENATLVLSGKFEQGRGRALVERYFGTIRGRPAPRRPPLPKLERKGPTRVEVGANVVEEAVHLSWITPAYGLPGDSELDWVSALLSRGEASLLSRRLVDKGLAISVSTRQQSRLHTGMFYINALAAKDHTADEILSTIDETLTLLGKIGPSPDDVARAASYWEVDDVFSLESAMGRAATLTSLATRGPITQPFDWREHGGIVYSPEHLRVAIAKYLSPTARAAQVIVRPKKGAPLAGVVVSREEP